MNPLTEDEAAELFPTNLIRFQITKNTSKIILEGRSKRYQGYDPTWHISGRIMPLAQWYGGRIEHYEIAVEVDGSPQIDCRSLTSVLDLSDPKHPATLIIEDMETGEERPWNRGEEELFQPKLWKLYDDGGKLLLYETGYFTLIGFTCLSKVTEKLKQLIRFTISSDYQREFISEKKYLALSETLRKMSI
jgi:hypothetical protein